MATSPSSLAPNDVEDLAQRIEASIRTGAPDMIVEQNEVNVMEDADFPDDTATNLAEVVMRPEEQSAAAASSRDPATWAVELAQRINALGLNLWKKGFPDPNHHRDYYSNSRDLEEFWGIAPGEMRPEHQPDIHRRWKRAMLIVRPDKHPGASQ